jgi:hypothetical protein
MQRTFGLQQRESDPSQFSDPRHGSGGDVAVPRTSPQRLRPTAVDNDVVQAQLLDGCRQPGCPSKQRLDQGQSEVGAHDGERDARQAGTRTKIGYAGSGLEQRVHHGAVEDVAIPQPRRLARANQAMRDPGVGQQRDVSLGEGQA